MWEAGQPFSCPIWISLWARFVNCCFQQRQILQPALSLTSPSSLYLPTGDSTPHPPPPAPGECSPSNSEFRSRRWVLLWESHLCICRLWSICTCQPLFFCRLQHPSGVSCCSRFTTSQIWLFLLLSNRDSLFMLTFPSLVCQLVTIHLLFRRFFLYILHQLSLFPFCSGKNWL